MSDYVASLLIALVVTVVTTALRNEYAIKLAKLAAGDAEAAKRTTRRTHRAVKTSADSVKYDLSKEHETAARRQGETDAKLDAALQLLDEMRAARATSREAKGSGKPLS
jgi:hypothetical protein